MRLEFPNKLVLSAMAGINNAEFCSKHPVGLAILGGFNADGAANEAAKRVVRRGRKEFIYDEPLESIEEEVKTLTRSFSGKFAINVRSATIDGYINTAEIAKKYGGIVEINAHCRQAEFIEIKCGQWLIFNPDTLFSVVKEVSEVDVPISVKLRGGLDVNYLNILRILKKAGCHIIHLDAMIEGSGNDLGLISKLAGEAFLIGNNSVVDVESAEKMLDAGAKMVSAARAVLKDSNFFEKLLVSPILMEGVEIVIYE
jgi:TIM-barrel protein